MQVELGVGGERWQARGQRGGEGACRRRWRGQACTGTVAGRVGELLGVGLGDPRVTHASCSHVGRQVETLGPQGHAPLLLDLLGLLDLLLLLLPLSQVITQQLALTLRQHLSIDSPLEERGGGRLQMFMEFIMNIKHEDKIKSDNCADSSSPGLEHWL